MTTINLPDHWFKFQIERDNYRGVWICWAIVDDWWYKGMAPTQGEAFDDLCAKVLAGVPVKQLQPVTMVTPQYGKSYRGAMLPPSAFEGIDLTKLDLDL